MYHYQAHLNSLLESVMTAASLLLTIRRDPSAEGVEGSEFNLGEPLNIGSYVSSFSLL